VTQPKLELRRLTKRFGAAPAVLDSVSLEIAAGEVVGLAGASGTGKSTLARCIAGLERADSGQLLLDGVPLANRRTLAQRRCVQYVWQEAHLALSPYRTALQSVTEPLEGFGLEPATERAATAAAWLSRMGLDAAAMQRRPDGLSGGQCQRVVLARALAAKPDLLLLDEPFSALDTVTTAALLRLLQEVLHARPASVLVVSHDARVLRRLSHRVLQLQGGRLSELVG
jgi:peptide/nickel transport system ATP-binding protein